MTHRLLAPCLFGLEGIAGDELRRMGMENVQVEDRNVFFTGDDSAIAKANICLRTGERILIVLAQFTAKTFEELFQGVYAANLEDYIPADGQFPVKGHCLNSQLMSISDCQAIIKKAASRRLGEKYGMTWLPETGVKFQLTLPSWYACESSSKRTLVRTSPSWMFERIGKIAASEGKEAIRAMSAS